MIKWKPTNIQEQILAKYESDKIKTLREFHKNHPLKVEVEYIENMKYAANYASLKGKFKDDIHIGRPIKRVEANRAKGKSK